MSDLITAVIVDDAPIEATFVQGILERVGVRVVATGADGEAGLRLIRQHRPTLAVLDIILAQLTGIEILAAVHNEDIPTACVMATSMLHFKKRCVEMGAVHFLTKPYEPVRSERELRKVVENLKG